MATWFLSDAGRHAMGGQVTASSTVTTVAASATVNTLGNWVQMFPTTPFPASNIVLFIGNSGIFASGANSQTLFDIGVGLSGAEQAIVQDVAIGGAAQFATWHFPLIVPSGSRVSMRLRSVTANKACLFGMMLWGGGSGVESGHRATTYGAVTATSRGTVLATPATANTKSAWTAVSAATTSPMRWMSVGLAAPNTATSAAANGLMDIGVGAAGVEAVLIADIPYRTSTAEDILAAWPMIYPVNLPAGVRLVARHQASAVSAAAVPNITITGIS